MYIEKEPTTDKYDLQKPTSAEAATETSATFLSANPLAGREILFFKMRMRACPRATIVPRAQKEIPVLGVNKDSMKHHRGSHLVPNSTAGKAISPEELRSTEASSKRCQKLRVRPTVCEGTIEGRLMVACLA